MRQEDEAGGPQDTGKAQEPEGSAEKAGSKKDKYQKAQAKAEHAGEKLGKAREKLDKTEAKRAAKKPPGLAKKAVRGVRTEAWFYVHNKIHEVEHENVGVEGAHKSELAAEAGTRKLTRYAKRRWQEHPARKVAKWERKDIKALFNLLDNAVKYTSAGGKIAVSVVLWEMYVEIKVTDTGKGISESNQAAIFRRFYREEEVHEQQGVGIGLYLAREIVTRQGGYIKVVSELGKGSAFSIMLPTK